MVFDAFTLFNELDLLDLRLNILGPYVDKFILVESRETFMGQEKPLYYEENKERFAKWNDKIIHIVAPNMKIEKVPFERHWACYELIENYLIKNADPEDVAFNSDLDEIWNPNVLDKVDDEPHLLEQLSYCYYLNQRTSEPWAGTFMSKVKHIYPGFTIWCDQTKPNVIRNAGFHFTNMGGVEQVLKKVSSYDHAHELNQDWLKEHMSENIEQGKDFLGRPLDYYGKPFEFWVDESEWPEYLVNNKERYKHLCK